jgi:hypothetical protein
MRREVKPATDLTDIVGDWAVEKDDDGERWPATICARPRVDVVEGEAEAVGVWMEGDFCGGFSLEGAMELWWLLLQGGVTGVPGPLPLPGCCCCCCLCCSGIGVAVCVRDNASWKRNGADDSWRMGANADDANGRLRLAATARGPPWSARCTAVE